jgi:hypothetical protein
MHAYALLAVLGIHPHGADVLTEVLAHETRYWYVAVDVRPGSPPAHTERGQAIEAATQSRIMFAELATEHPAAYALRKQVVVELLVQLRPVDQLRDHLSPKAVSATV